MNKPVFSAIGIERLRVFRDGEGITTLVAGYGCPLRCRYCLNPQCFAWEKPAKTYELAQLIEEVAVDDLYFQATGGGVVFGGGEPLLQADFIHAFRRSCPSQWKLYLETSLSVPQKELEKVLDDIDYFLVDIKDMDPEIYKNYTGKENTEMLLNLRLLAEKQYQNKVTLRLPLIPGYNTSASQEQSKNVLEKMGFRSFDLFSYEVDHALNKRKKAIDCNQQREAPSALQASSSSVPGASFASTLSVKREMLEAAQRSSQSLIQVPSPQP